MRPERRLAVALHDIEPATFERAALIREWLDDLGVDRVTLLVIPAADLHPLSDRRPEVATWLLERAQRGDSIAQHGFHHMQSRPARWRPAPRAAIAPAYAYTPQLRDSLRTRFDWWAGSWALHPTRSGARQYRSTPPIGLAACGPLRRAMAPSLLRATSRTAGRTLRLDLHPGDLASASHMLALEDVIRRAMPSRTCVTYDELASSG